jgi:hypothetical protein
MLIRSIYFEVKRTSYLTQITIIATSFASIFLGLSNKDLFVGQR